MDVHKVQLKSDTHTNVYENIYKFSCINQQRARELYKKVKSVLLSG